MTKKQLKAMKTRSGIRSIRKQNKQRKLDLQKMADAKNELTQNMQ